MDSSWFSDPIDRFEWQIGFSGLDRVGGLGTVACQLLLDPMDRYGMIDWVARVAFI